MIFWLIKQLVNADQTLSLSFNSLNFIKYVIYELRQIDKHHDKNRLFKPPIINNIFRNKLHSLKIKAKTRLITLK